MPSTALHRYAIFMVAATLVLIAAGGLVTSTDSGLSVPDWPLSYGRLMPPMVGGIRFEHTHRVIAGTVGLLTLGLAALCWRVEKRGWVRGFALGAVAAVIAQAVLGGLTVIYLLPDWISVAHATLGQSFLCLLGALALFTSREWAGRPALDPSVDASVRRLLAVTTALVWAQLVAGAIVRHSGHGLRWHFAIAFLVAVHVLAVLGKLARDERLMRPLYPHALALGGLVTLQVFLGFAAYVFVRRLRGDVAPLGEVLVTTAHQTTGALILLTSLLLTLRSYRLLRRPSERPAAAGAVAEAAS